MKININNTKLNVYKKVLQEACEKFNRAEDFIKGRIVKLCSNGRLSVENVTFFYERLRQLLKLNLVVFC